MDGEIEYLKQESRRAEEARRILQSEAFVSAFEDLRKDLNEQMSSVKITDEATQLKLVQMWKLLDSLERWFVKTIETGEAAELHLEEKKKFGLWPK